MSAFHRAALLIILFASLAGCRKAFTVDSIEDMQWQHRVLIVQADGQDQQINNVIKENTAGINDRDMIWLVLSEGGAQSNLSDVSSSLLKSARSYVTSPGETEVILIGKDGGVKSRADALDLQDIFNQIDAMPMRQREMRGNR